MLMYKDYRRQRAEQDMLAGAAAGAGGGGGDQPAGKVGSSSPTGDGGPKTMGARGLVPGSEKRTLLGQRASGGDSTDVAYKTF